MIGWESVYNLESYMEEIGLYEQAKGKKLLIIGGETNIANIVNEAKKMGVYTIVTERDGGTPLPAKLIADEAWDVDYTDMDTLSRMCREAGVSGVMSGYSEGKVLCAAKLAQRIGTPFYVTPEQVEITRDKRSFKDLCVKYDVPVPKEYCSTGKMTEAEKELVEYPVIVKPADYGGRIGISVCRNREELDLAVEKAEKSSITGTVVVEEYVSGTELIAIYTLSGGEISLSIINEKHLSREGNLYACLCDVAMTPSKYYNMYVETVDAKIRDFLKGIGMKDGLAGFQFIANEEKITAFETGLRLNGGNDWKLLEACNGINHLKMMINHSLTGDMGDSLSKDNPVFDEYMCTYVMYAHGGEVGEFSYAGLEDCKEIIDISPYAKVGKLVPDRGTTQQRVISFKIRAVGLREVEETIRLIQEKVIVNDVNGNSMLFASFDTARLYQ